MTKPYVWIRGKDGSGRIKCPGCGLMARADPDQMAGRVSLDCPECDYHETHDLREDQPAKGGAK